MLSRLVILILGAFEPIRYIRLTNIWNESFSIVRVIGRLLHRATALSTCRHLIIILIVVGLIASMVCGHVRSSIKVHLSCFDWSSIAIRVLACRIASIHVISHSISHIWLFVLIGHHVKVI